MGSQARLSEDVGNAASAPALSRTSSLRTENLRNESLRKSVSFHEDNLAEMSSSRRRVGRREGGGGEESHSSADESAPIIRYPQSSAKDYQSISPNLAARNLPIDGANASANQERAREGEREGTDAQRAAAEVERKESSRWRKMLDKYGSVELENKGSVARDHLALGVHTPPPPFPVVLSPLPL